MIGPIRRLNDRGREAFREWLEDGAIGTPPLGLLDDSATSLPLHPSIPRPMKIYERRYDLGLDLVDRLDDVHLAELQLDVGLWDWLSLCLIDQICPSHEAGRRKPLKIGHYLLELDNYKTRNRHLVRSAWSLVRRHGADALFMLTGSLSSHGEAVEQLMNRQEVVTCKPLIAAIGRLVWDSQKETFKRGFGGKGAGSARRVPVVAKQFRLTYDLDSMQPNQILDLLPREFDRFRSEGMPPNRRASRVRIKQDAREQPSADSLPS